MRFKTVQEAFNHYRNESLEDMEKRAGEIKGTIETDPKADITTLNIELTGLFQAKQNAMEKQGGDAPATDESTPQRGMKYLEGMEQRAQVRAGEDIFSAPEYRNAFFKTMLGKKLDAVESRAFKQGLDESEKRASSFNASGNSSAILPTTTLNEIISKARTMGGLMGECRAFNMPTGISIPVATPAAKAAWHTEGAAVDAESVTTAAVTFSGYEIVKIFSISVKAKTMSIAAFESYIVTELTNCVMETIADALVNGTGSAQGTGLLTGITWDATNALTFSKTAGLTYIDVVKAAGTLKRGYANGAKWAMNNHTLYNSFYGLTDTTGRPVFIADPKAESIGKVLGFDVVVDDNLADDVILFGNFQYMAYNMPGGIMLETSRESSFRSGLIDYRAMAVADCKPVLSDAFVKLTRATA